MKRLLILFAVVFGLTVAQASAQTITGTWELFPSYSTPTKVVETPEFVYVLSSTSLCGYDKTTGELCAFNASHRLNGNTVENIWYNPEEKYLFVLHTDENIDFVYDNGKTVNVPDLRDATISTNKTVQDVGFAAGKAYLATKSGMLVIDATHGAVTESCLWGYNIIAIAATESKIILWRNWNSADTDGMYVADRNASHHNFEQSFSKITSWAVSAYPNVDGQRSLHRISDDKLVVNHSSAAVLITVDNEATNNATACTSKTISGVTFGTSDQASPTKDGLLVKNGETFYYIGSDGTLQQTVTAAEASGKLAADWNSNGSQIWLADTSGYGLYDVAASDYEISPLRPESVSGSNVGMLRQTSTGDVYMSTLTRSPIISVSADYLATYLDVYSADDASIQPIPATSFPKTIYSMAINPKNEDELLVAYRDCVVKYNVFTGDTYTYNSSTAPFVSGLIFNDVAVDNDGNLWILHRSIGTTETLILYKALAGSWEDGVEQSGWSQFDLSELAIDDHSSRMVIDETNRIIVVFAKGQFMAIKMPDKNDPLTTSTQSFVHSATIDEDGATMSVGRMSEGTIDKNGWIWVGTSVGVFVIRDSKPLLQSSFAPMRPKVARNDGTNLADYLLDNVAVCDIAVDENNDKWISTEGSGLYRVNSDGTEIITNFTVDSSDIPSDNIYCALADKFSNKIFVGTDIGLSIYHATTAPAADSYDEVYAYPNPVTPDYTGYITITGLKSDSLVKIADASGNVFYETRSDGGLATWNGCDASGRRVKSGVYFVFASQSGETSSSAAVTKIVVVN